MRCSASDWNPSTSAYVVFSCSRRVSTSYWRLFIFAFLMTLFWRGIFHISTFVAVMHSSISSICSLIFSIASSPSNVSQMVATLFVAFAQITSPPLIFSVASDTVVLLSSSTFRGVLGICQACRSSTWW